MKEQKYPEHEKLQAIKEKSQAIGEFLEWLQGKGFRLAKWEKEPDEEEQLVQQFPNIERLLAEYFQIDLAKLEKEKYAMLEYMRKQNKQIAKIMETKQ